MRIYWKGLLDGIKLKSLIILLIIYNGLSKKLKDVLGYLKILLKLKKNYRKNPKILVVFLIYVYLYEFLIILYI